MEGEGGGGDNLVTNNFMIIKNKMINFHNLPSKTIMRNGLKNGVMLHILFTLKVIGYSIAIVHGVGVSVFNFPFCGCQLNWSYYVVHRDYCMESMRIRDSHTRW